MDKIDIVIDEQEELTKADLLVKDPDKQEDADICIAKAILINKN